jgi:hypothetical protein
VQHLWKNMRSEGLVAEGSRPSLGESMILAPPAVMAVSDSAHGEEWQVAAFVLQWGPS